MPLETGRRLGPYEILAPLGAGGMGEVYEAKDTRLGRTVAIKVLPEGLAEHPERRARFEREARTVSQLTHPHVCTLHDVGEEEGLHFLVMEHLEGETLAERLERGALPLEDTLRYGAQIAEALDGAHRRGVIHRDLKPANVMLTGSGVKLLDFGLARIAAGGKEEVADLPTMTMGDVGALTDEGTVLGTYPYMAPEQVEGAEADARSDIFALGAVLYEMVTGERAFTGESAASVMAAVLREEPEPLTKVQPVSPPALDHVVSRCLAKDPDRRWQTARDVAEELRWIREAGSQAGVAAPVAKRRKSRERLAWGIAGLLALLLALTLGWVGRSPKEEETTRAPFFFTIPPPDGTGHASIPAMSPDGLRVAFVAFPDEDGPQRLWIRPIDSVDAQPLAGTEGAGQPFWSPDGRSLGFFAFPDAELKRIDLASGAVRSLAPVKNPDGGTWSTSGAILFADENLGLLQVAEAGGPSSPVELFGDEAPRGCFWPHMLPDGRRLLVTCWTVLEEGGLVGGLYLGSLDGGEPRLLRSASGPNVMGRPQYDPAGYVLFHSDEGGGPALLAQGLDLDRGKLTGDPFQVAEPVFSTAPGQARFSVGPGGLLVLREAASNVRSQLQWLDRGGELLESVGPPDAWDLLELSPDGSTVAIPLSGEGIWLLDARRGTAHRIAEGWGWRPVWSPDGRRLAFAAGGPPNPFVLNVAAGGEAERVTVIPAIAGPMDWAPDGEHLVIVARGNPAQLLLLSLTSGELEPLLSGDRTIRNARVSPDGRWLAYTSAAETDQSEVYVTAFPRPGRRWRISGAGGDVPRWSSDGASLLYQKDDQVVEVPVDSEGDVVHVGEPRVVLEQEGLLDWDVAADGRFLVALPRGEPIRPPLVVISDWRAAAGVEVPR